MLESERHEVTEEWRRLRNKELSELFSYTNGMKSVAQLVEALRYKKEGRGFDSRWCH
jgi:hypothetical protein